MPPIARNESDQSTMVFGEVTGIPAEGKDYTDGWWTFGDEPRLVEPEGQKCDAFPLDDVLIERFEDETGDRLGANKPGTYIDFALDAYNPSGIWELVSGQRMSTIPLDESERRDQNPDLQRSSSLWMPPPNEDLDWSNLWLPDLEFGRHRVPEPSLVSKNRQIAENSGSAPTPTPTRTSWRDTNRVKFPPGEMSTIEAAPTPRPSQQPARRDTAAVLMKGATLFLICPLCNKVINNFATSHGIWKQSSSVANFISTSLEAAAAAIFGRLNVNPPSMRPPAFLETPCTPLFLLAGFILTLVYVKHADLSGSPRKYALFHFAAIFLAGVMELGAGGGSGDGGVLAFVLYVVPWASLVGAMVAEVYYMLYSRPRESGQEWNEKL